MMSPGSEEGSILDLRKGKGRKRSVKRGWHLGSILGLKQICSCANIGVSPLKKVYFPGEIICCDPS